MLYRGSLTGKELGAFKEKHFTAENMVLAAAGVQHEEFVALAQKYMGKLPRGDGTTGAKRKAALYTGGEARLELPESAMDPNTRIAVGFEVRAQMREEKRSVSVLQSAGWACAMPGCGSDVWWL